MSKLLLEPLMAGPAPGQAAEEPAKAARTKLGEGLKGRRLEGGLGLLFGALSAALLASAAFLLAPSLFRLSRVDLEGAVTLSKEDVMEAGLIREGGYLFAIDPDRVERALLSSPRIAEARVERVLPNKLSVFVRERKAVVLAVAEMEGRSRIVAIDESGIAFAQAGLDARGAPGFLGASREIPILSGLRFEGFKLGTRLPESLRTLLSSLAAVEASAPALLAAFSEIRVVKPRYGELELLLYPIHMRVPVRARSTLNEETLRSIIFVLDVLAAQGLGSDVEEVDFRSGTIVYRIKEGQSD